MNIEDWAAENGLKEGTVTDVRVKLADLLYVQPDNLRPGDADEFIGEGLAVVRSVARAAQVRVLREMADEWCPPGCGEYGPGCAGATSLRARADQIERGET